jgi:hypothetical protein
MVEISDRIRSARNARGISGCDDFYSQGRYKGLTFLLREAWPDIQHDSPDDTESYPTPTTAAPLMVAGLHCAPDPAKAMRRVALSERDQPRRDIASYSARSAAAGNDLSAAPLNSTHNARFSDEWARLKLEPWIDSEVRRSVLDGAKRSPCRGA